MRRLICLAALAAVVSAGCGSTRPGAAPLLTDFQRLERDTQAYNPGAPATGMLSAGEAKRDEAAAAINRGSDELALPMMESAVADARAALAAAQADVAAQQASECAQAVEKARRSWDEALRQLIETEQVARRTSADAPHQLQGAQNLIMPSLPPTSVSGASAPHRSADSLEAESRPWLEMASSHRISTAELENRFHRQLAQARDPKTSKEERSRQLYLAGRSLQELEALVRQGTAEELCAQATGLLTGLSDARASALRGILDLERGMKDELRTELESTRAQAADRASHLWDALQPFATSEMKMTRDSRGIVVTLLTDSLFALGQDAFVPAHTLGLVRLATILNQFPEMKVAIEGSTDNVGEPDYNLDLSKRRAVAVQGFLLNQGVAAVRMTAEGYGMNRPLTNNTTEAERRENRRVDLIIQKQP